MARAGWITKRTKGWPEGTRGCTRCKEVKPLESFGPFKKGARGRYPICNECRKPIAAAEYQKERKSYQLYYRAKRRAFEKNLDFSITEEDIIEVGIPSICPVFGVPMKGRYAHSLDRIDSSKGYIKGNIQVISRRANTLKGDATAEELRKVADFCEIVTVGEVHDG